MPKHLMFNSAKRRPAKNFLGRPPGLKGLTRPAAPAQASMRSLINPAAGPSAFDQLQSGRAVAGQQPGAAFAPGSLAATADYRTPSELPWAQQFPQHAAQLDAEEAEWQRKRRLQGEMAALQARAAAEPGRMPAGAQFRNLFGDNPPQHLSPTEQRMLSAMPSQPFMGGLGDQGAMARLQAQADSETRRGNAMGLLSQSAPMRTATADERIAQTDRPLTSTMQQALQGMGRGGLGAADLSQQHSAGGPLSLAEWTAAKKQRLADAMAGDEDLNFVGGWEGPGRSPGEFTRPLSTTELLKRDSPGAFRRLTEQTDERRAARISDEDRQRMVTAKAQGQRMSPGEATMQGLLSGGQELTLDQRLAQFGPQGAALSPAVQQQATMAALLSNLPENATPAFVQDIRAASQGRIMPSQTLPVKTAQAKEKAEGDPLVFEEEALAAGMTKDQVDKAGEEIYPDWRDRKKSWYTGFTAKDVPFVGETIDQLWR